MSKNPFSRKRAKNRVYTDHTLESKLEAQSIMGVPRPNTISLLEDLIADLEGKLNLGASYVSSFATLSCQCVHGRVWWRSVYSLTESVLSTRSAPGADPVILKKTNQGKAKPKQKREKHDSGRKNAPATADPNQPDICKLEFKVGRITKVWVHPDADKLYCEEIDCGEEGGARQIASGLRMHYSEDDMLGKRVLVVANLKVNF